MSSVFKKITKTACSVLAGFILAAGSAALAASYTVSGHVQDQNSNALAYINLIGVYPGNMITGMTDGTGYYSITFPDGVTLVTITPESTPNTEFTPSSATLTLSGDYTQNFLGYVTAQPSGYSISGTISGTVVNGVTVKVLCGGSIESSGITASDGSYSIDLSPEANNTNCIVTPQPLNPSNYFSPDNSSVYLYQSQTADFTANTWPSGGSASWQLVPTAADASPASVPSIDIDTYGGPHLAYINNSGVLKYLVFSGSSPVETFSQQSFADSNVSISPYNDNIYLSYRNYISTGSPEMWFLTNEGGMNSGLSIGQAGPSTDMTLKVNSFGRFLLYRGEFLSLWANGTTTAISSDTACGLKSSMFVDSSGTIHVIYSCSGSSSQTVMYQRLPYGGSWTEPQLIADTAQFAPATTVNSVSMSADMNGGPFAAFTVSDGGLGLLYAALPDSQAVIQITTGIYSNAVAFCDKDLKGLLFTQEDYLGNHFIKRRLYVSESEFSQVIVATASAKTLSYSKKDDAYIAFTDNSGNLTAGYEGALYTLSGYLRENGNALQNAWVTVTNGVSTFTVQTDASGYYSVPGLEKGSYTITPFMDGKVFSPAQGQANVESVTQLDFAGYDASVNTYAVYGQVTGSVSGGVNITVSIGGTVAASTQTGSDGMYVFSSIPAGECAVVPSLSGYTFSPASASFTLSSSRGGVSFTSYQESASTSTYSASGRVTLYGSGLSGVLVVYSNEQNTYTSTTTSSGDYGITGIVPGDYMVIPSLSGYGFSPSYSTVTINGDMSFGEQFIASVSSGTTGILSGTISVSTGGYAAGITVSAYDNSMLSTTTVNTDYMGRFTFTLPLNRSYTITPSTGAYTFTLASQFISLMLDTNGVNFTATPVQAAQYYSVSGYVTDTTSAPVYGIEVYATDGVHVASVATNASGYYEFTSVPAGSFVLHAASGGYEFSPASATVVVVNANISNVNFIRQNLSTPLYTLSGRITANSVGLYGVEVMATDGMHSETVMTGSDGSYSFTDFAAGTYYIQPHLSGYAFTPASSTVVVASDTANVNFTAEEKTVVIAASITAVNRPYSNVYGENEIFNMSLYADGETYVSSITISFEEPGISYADVQSVAVYEGSTYIASVYNSVSSVYYDQRQVTLPVSLTIVPAIRYFTIKVRYRDSAIGKDIYPQVRYIYADSEITGASIPVAGVQSRLGYEISASNSSGDYTNVYLNAGQSARIIAAGSWNVSASTTVGPDGVSGSICGSGCPMPAYPRGMLLAKFGYSSTGYYPIGSSNTITMPWGAVSNSIYLLMNDDNYADNSGSVFVVPSVVARQIFWTGAGNTESASDSANWVGSIMPSNGDAVVFSTISSKSCEWDLYSKPQSILLDNYAGTLKVSGYSALQAEGLYLNKSSLLVSGSSAGGKPSISVGTLSSIQSALTFDNASSINSDGTVVIGGTVTIRGSDYTKFSGAAGYPVQITMARVNISSVMFTNGSILELSIPEITAFDNIVVERSVISATPMVRLVQMSGKNYFRNWVFRNYSSGTPYNVASTSSVAGVENVFLNASGDYMGSVHSLNMDGALRWEPDGGATGAIVVRAEYATASTPTYHFSVYSSTGGLVVSGTSAEGNDSVTFYGLTAPATYYISAAADINFDSVIGGYDPRGKDAVWLPAASTATAVVTLMDFGKLYGTATSLQQQGTLIGQAYQGGNIAVNEPLTYISGTSPHMWELYVPTGTYDFRTFVDMQANGQYDSFEASYLFEKVMKEVVLVITQMLLTEYMNITTL